MARATTPLGDMQGTDFEGYERYAGIRYAEAPTGDLRFRAPVPTGAWTGTYDATAFGASAPQPPPIPGAVGVAREMVTDQDCLFLNVYTPKADDGQRPVMVWIHGGAYTMGQGDLYDGAAFCQRGDVVVVTLNYRLGALGWMPVDHLDASYTGSGNNGLRDQIAALQWVQDNIGSFGGTPDNVTIFGESAGGGSVFALLAAPAADGLYHKAIVESGAGGFGPPRGAEKVTEAMLEHLGQPAGGIDALLTASAEEILAAQLAQPLFEVLGTSADYTLDGAGIGCHPVVDGVVVTRTVPEALAAKAQRNVPLIVGTNKDEGTLFALLLPQGVTDEQVGGALSGSTADPSKILDAFRARKSGRHVLVDLFTDTVFRVPSLRAADAQVESGVPAWVYLFTWETPVFGGMLGATHALEIPFVWNTVRDPAWAMLVGAEPPVQLADAMQDAWIQFARTGDPNRDGLTEWPQYNTTERPTMEFGRQIGVVNDPDGEMRSLWYATSPT